MYVGGISGQLWTVATTTYGIGVGAVVSVFVGCWVVIKWHNVKSWIEDRVSGRAEVKLKHIFNTYLKQVASIKDRRELYAEILKIVSNLAKASDVSLLLKNPSANEYIIRECLGSKPTSFQLKHTNELLSWLAEFQKSLTRAELVECSEFSKIKSSGLQYCVQFHAEAIIPLVIGSDLIGIINIGCKDDGREFDNYLFEVFDLMSGQFAVAIHNANLYEGLLRQNAKLKELDSLKSQLLANVSHELRTPLNSIIGLSDLMVDGADGELSKEQTSHISMIKHSGERLLESVSALLDLSKLESNRLSLDVKRVNLKRIIEDTNRVIKDIKDNKDHLNIKIDIDETTPPVYGDSMWIGRIFNNLITNAVKYTSTGSVNIDYSRAGDMLKIGVHDTGIGIKKEDQRKIFDGFTQASSGHDREHEGTGLGLAISKKIVELHGGRIWLSSQPGRGSHFYFTLPLKPNLIPSMELNA